MVHKAKADRDVGERCVEKHIGRLGGVELHEGIEHVEFLEVQVGNAQGVTARIDSQILARVDAVELEWTAGVCRGARTVYAFGGKRAAGGKVFEAHIDTGKVEDADGMLDCGHIELLEREQDRYDDIVKLSELLARLAPMLGLLGTLIPLGPGIIALGQGDTYTLSTSLLTAFDTTIAGLVAAALAIVVSAIRRRWYREYGSVLEALCTEVLELTKKGEAR